MSYWHPLRQQLEGWPMRGMRNDGLAKLIDGRNGQVRVRPGLEQRLPRRWPNSRVCSIAQ